MVVSLLKIELLSTAETLDSSEFYSGECVAFFVVYLLTKCSTPAHDPVYCPQ